MRVVATLLLFLFSSITVSASPFMPADHSICLNASMGTMLMSCEEGMDFYTDHYGRCGCLSMDEVIPPLMCRVELIRCDSHTTEKISFLFQKRLVNRQLQDTFAGCACISTDESTHRTPPAPR